MPIEFSILLDLRLAVGESPVYDDSRDVLWFCDIPARTVHQLDLTTRERRHWLLPSEVGSLGLAESGRLVVALRHEIGLFDPADGSFVAIASIEAERGADTRLNDGKVGPDGAFWVGTMDDRSAKEPVGALYRVTADGRVEKKVEGLIVPNGLAFSADGGTLFHSDSRGKWIDRWDLDAATGAIANRSRIAEMDEASGRPDGGATDMEGCYWSAGVSAARLNRFSRDGRLLEVHPVPVASPSMPCFGGADMRTLYVTSLREGRSAEALERYPQTGSVLVGRSAVAGAPVTRFRDR
jgi:sugar lactone lactonase YvrE